MYRTANLRELRSLLSVELNEVSTLHQEDAAFSYYLKNIGGDIVQALENVPRAQPPLVAGYWANIEFWLEEFEHLVNASRGYEARLGAMKSAFDRYVLAHGSLHNRDEAGVPYQAVISTTASSERERVIGAARKAILGVAERALNLGIISYTEYDQVLECLRQIVDG